MKTTRAPRYMEEEHWALQEAIKKIGPNWRRDLTKFKATYDQILKEKFPNKQFPDRDSKALRSHWDQMIKKGPDNYPWSEDEIQKLVNLHAENRDNYSLIAYQLGTGRSIPAIKKKLREIMDENLLDPESPILNTTSTFGSTAMTKVQRFRPVMQVVDTSTRIDELESSFEEKLEELREEFENVQTELKEVKEALHGVIQALQKPQKQ